MELNFTPLVTIVMPAYNAAAFIEEAIDSIRAQSYTNWELLIADDGSADQTSSIIDHYTQLDQRIHHYPNEKNCGYLKTCNKLLKLGKGDLLGFQDADDFSDPLRIEKQVREFHKNPSLGLCATFSHYFYHETREIFKKRTGAISDQEIKSEIKKSSQFSCNSILISRAVYEDIGGYQEFYDRIFSEDYDWACRISEKYVCYNIPEYLYNGRISKNSLTRNINNPMQLISEKAAHFLIEQRANNSGKDGLNSEGKLQTDFYDFVANEKKKFEMDASLIHRRVAEKSMYARLYNNALQSSWKAILAQPLGLVNYRTWFYCFRHSLFGTNPVAHQKKK